MTGMTRGSSPLELQRSPLTTPRGSCGGFFQLLGAASPLKKSPQRAWQRTLCGARQMLTSGRSMALPSSAELIFELGLSLMV